jgi:hypothetical protein
VKHDWHTPTIKVPTLAELVVQARELMEANVAKLSRIRLADGRAQDARRRAREAANNKIPTGFDRPVTIPARAMSIADAGTAQPGKRRATA